MGGGPRKQRRAMAQGTGGAAARTLPINLKSENPSKQNLVREST